MQLRIMIFVFLVLTIEITTGAVLFSSNLLTRVKRGFSCRYYPSEIKTRFQSGQDEPWSWGIAEDLKVTPRDNVETRVEPTEAPPMATPIPDIETTTRDFFEQLLAEYDSMDNPCKHKPPAMPDFSMPGRRISEQKCYEYIWGIKHRIEQEEYDKKCTFHIEVFGGVNASPGTFPHMAAIGWKAAKGTWAFKCGGSIISPKFVLTAAHCSSTTDRDTEVADVIPKMVRVGNINILDHTDDSTDPPYTDVNIIKIIKHPQYKSPKKYFDIALLELETELKFTFHIQPACLWTTASTDSLGQRANLTGWGVVGTTRRTSPDLQVAEVDILPSKTCDELLIPITSRHWQRMFDHQICAGILAGGVDACQGDSGGPLQVKIDLPPDVNGSMHHVFGLTSFGFGCALPNTPGVYTRVSSFIDWIEGIVWK